MGDNSAGTTSSTSTGGGTPSSSVLNLGKLFARELEDHDALGRWMAHHIAELIQRAESSSEATRLSAEGDAREAILQLWRHRASLPGRGRPFSSFEPVFAGLERLGEDKPWRFSRIFDAGHEPGQEAVEVNMFLKAALALETDVREIVVAAIAMAADAAEEADDGWLTAARAISETEEVSAVRQLAQLKRRLRPPNPDDQFTHESLELDEALDRSDIDSSTRMHGQGGEEVTASAAMVALLRRRLERLRQNVDGLLGLIGDQTTDAT